MSPQMVMMIVALIGLAIEEAPGLIDWIKKRKAEGRPITMDDVEEIKALWGKPGTDYFEPPKTTG